MKSYKYLWDDFISDENIKLAISNSAKGKKRKRRKDVKFALEHTEEYIQHIKEYAMDYKNKHHEPKVIYDGISRKKRTIIVPSFDELVVQHMIVQVLQPMFLKGTYEHAYGSIPKRGAHKGKSYIEKWIRNDTKNCKYCLKLDIKHYFESIPHDRLKEKLSKYIKDKKILSVLFEIIDVIDIGLPLGFYTSQWLSMWYLKNIDHVIKEQSYAPHYIRYMDDIVIFGANKRKLWKTYEFICEILKHDGLKLNNKRQLFRFSYFKNSKEYGRQLDFMGFCFHRDRTVLRRGIYYKMCRKAHKISAKEKPTIYELRQMMSYLGWIKSTDIYNSYLQYVKPFFSFQKAKRRISKNDRRNNYVETIRINSKAA